MPERIGNVMSWATDLDPNALQQALTSSKMPFVKGHLALMPDAHFGRGSTVGSVIPTQGAVMPAAVGVDLGCGMAATKLNLKSTGLPDDLRKLHNRISRSVPAGVGQGHEPGAGKAGTVKYFPEFPETSGAWDPKWKKNALLQFGSLGAGNHFVEVCLDEEDYVWIVLHSGSRGVGNKVASMHIDKAVKSMKDLEVKLEDRDLSYIMEGTPEFQAYITDMLWAQDYALGNRNVMMDAVLLDVFAELGGNPGVVKRINCHHNFTQKEIHDGNEVWLTRKGAIQARVGDEGIIPGSMGAKSFIVSGLGNPLSYNSCSHGAGRRLGRKQAERELDRETFEKSMKDITWNNDSKKLLDEDPRAYKDIDQVMKNQSDLVKIEHTLHQVLNYKGA